MCLEGAIPNTPFQEEKQHTSPQAIEDVIDSSPNYELISVISHRGNSTASGHYVCHRKYNDKWILLNDNYVMEDGDLKDAYLLFYKNKV